MGPDLFWEGAWDENPCSTNRQGETEIAEALLRPVERRAKDGEAGAQAKQDCEAQRPIWTHERSECARRASCRDAASQPTRAKRGQESALADSQSIEPLPRKCGEEPLPSVAYCGWHTRIFSEQISQPTVT